MPTLPLHPAAVHVPLGLAAVLPFVAVAIAFAAFRRGPSRSHVLLLTVLQAIVFGSGLVAARLGEQDEDRVERVIGEAAIERHEERAERFVWASGLVFAAASVVLVLPRRAQRAGLATVAAGTVVVAALAFRAGEAGGELVYARGAAAAWQADFEGESMPAVADEHGDD